MNPTAGDIDADGDIDLIVGESNGGMFFIENLAGPNQAVNFASVVGSYGNIDVSTFLAPQIIDLDEDGMNDLVVGVRNGTMYFFKNIGSPGNAEFEADQNASPNIAMLGNVNTRKLGNSLDGYAEPHFYMEDGEMKMIAGTYESGMMRYGNITDNLDGVFSIESAEHYGDIYEGRIASLDMADIDNNGFYDVVMGNKKGGFGFWQTNISSGIVDGISKIDANILSISPNPATEMAQIAGDRGFDNVTMFSIDQKVVKQFGSTRPRDVLDLKGINNGVYYLIARSKGQLWTSKLVIAD